MVSIKILCILLQIKNRIVIDVEKKISFASSQKYLLYRSQLVRIKASPLQLWMSKRFFKRNGDYSWFAVCHFDRWAVRASYGRVGGSSDSYLRQMGVEGELWLVLLSRCLRNRCQWRWHGHLLKRQKKEIIREWSKNSVRFNFLSCELTRVSTLIRNWIPTAILESLRLLLSTLSNHFFSLC